MILEQGDVISLNFDPSMQHESAGRHYAVVLSPWHVNRMSALTLVAPITSTDNGFPLHIPIADENDIHGFIQCEAIRAVDLAARKHGNAVEVTGSLDDSTLARTIAAVLIVLGVEEI